MNSYKVKFLGYFNSREVERVVTIHAETREDAVNQVYSKFTVNTVMWVKEVAK